MANGPYGPQTGGAPSPGPYAQRGGKQTGPYTKPATAGTRHMRAILRSHGYQVDAGGGSTTRLATAWRDYRNQVGSGGGINPRKWNANNPVTRAPGLKQSIAKAQASPPRAHGGGGGFKGTDPDPVAKQVQKATNKATKVTATHIKAKAGAAALGANSTANPGVKVPGVPVPSYGNPNVNKLVAPGTADKIAGEQYDPQILQTETNMAQGKRDAAQHQADLSNWYGQVEGSQNTASQRDQAAADSARGSVSNEIQSILQSLGGSRASGVVGAQGVSDLAALAAQGASQEQYNADLAPILKGEEAGQHARQQALASQQAQALATQLTGLRGARGQALVKAQANIEAQNNQARQQNFGNRLAEGNAAIAAKSLGFNQGLDIAKLKLQGADTASVIAARRAATKAERIKLGLGGKAAGAPPNWAQLNSQDRATVLNNAIAQAASEIPVEKGKDHWDSTHVLNSTLSLLRSGGYTSARKPGYKGGGVVPLNQSQILLGVNRGIAAARQHYNTLAGLPPSQ